METAAAKKITPEVSRKLVLFTLDEHRFGLDLESVDRVVRAVEIVPLPQAPRVVRGVVVVAGAPVPVIDLRVRFGYPERQLSLSDQFLLVRTSRRALIFIVDAVEGVRSFRSSQISAASELVPGLEHVKGLAQTSSELVLIQDVEACLSLEEEAALDTALSAAP